MALRIQIQPQLRKRKSLHQLRKKKSLPQLLHLLQHLPLHLLQSKRKSQSLRYLQNRSSSMSGLMAKNATMRAGIVSPHKYIPRLLPLIEQGRLDPSEIITHRLPLDRAIEGYRVFANHEEDVLKVVLEP